MNMDVGGFELKTFHVGNPLYTTTLWSSEDMRFFWYIFSCCNNK